MTDLKKNIDKELESMTFNELRNRRSIKMKRNFKIKKITAVCAAVIAAAMALAVSTSAMGLWSISDLIDDIFPNRNASEREKVETYAFEVNTEINENSMQYDISFDNVICDGNILIAQFVVTRRDGGGFTEESCPNIYLSDDIIFPDIHDINNKDDGSHVGRSHNILSDDKQSLIINREFADLPRTVRTGEELYIRFSGLRELSISPDKTASIETLDDGRQVIKFTVPEIEEPVPLEFKNPHGEIVFTAKLTHLSMKAVSDKLDFEQVYYDSSALPDNIDPLDAQAVADWYADEEHLGREKIYPKFLDENMEYTENKYNGNIYRTDEYGNKIPVHASVGSYSGKNDSVVVFIDDPELEKVKYIEWFGCIAEIPDMSEE